MTEGQVQPYVSNEEKVINELGMIDSSLQEIGEYLCNISESLWKLSKCVGYVPPAPRQKEGYHILRIGGSVDNGNY